MARGVVSMVAWLVDGWDRVGDCRDAHIREPPAYH